ncbi:MAG: hypothetical protein KGI29_05635 [Pseudomonadota bacterium]|nr:hypothetical protein [Pseudomonadota bacterium]MDE3037716.1 hypothetical protein [Pseudomonadota bacterium]
MALSSIKRELYSPDGNGFLIGLMSYCSRGKLPNLRKKLQAAGTDFAREDFIDYKAYGKFPALICSDGNSDNARPITHIDYIMSALNEIGDPIRLQDWLLRFEEKAGTYTVIGYAGYCKCLDKVFKPDLWVNRIAEMEALWQMVPSVYKSKIDFEKLKADAQALSGPEFKITSSLKKEQLFTANDNGLAPFDDSRTWKKFDQIVEILDGKRGQKLTKDDFLRKNGKGRTYLEIGINAGQQDKIFDLLERHGDKLTAQDIKDHNLGHLFTMGNQAFWDAAVNNDLAKVKAALRLGLIDLEYKRTTDEGTALWACAHKGDADMVEALAAAGANADVKIGKYNPIHIAAYKGGTEVVGKVVAALEKQYADNPAALFDALTRKDGDNETPIQETGHNSFRDAVPIIEAAISRAQLKMVTQGNPDVTKVFSDGNTFLNVAARAGDLPLIQRTVKKLQQIYKYQPQQLYGALTQKGTDDRTPEDAARNAGKTEAADVIKEATTQVMVARGSIWDVYCAAERGDAALIKRFAAAKTADFNAGYGDKKWPPVMIAAYKGQEAAYDALIEGGANPDARSSERYNASALTMAGYAGATAIAQKIIPKLKEKYGDDATGLFKALTFKDCDGYSPYMAAKGKGQNSTAAVIDQAVMEMLPQVLEWDAKTLKDTEAYRVLGERGKLPELFKAERWKGKLAELQETWKALPSDYASQVKYDDAFAAAYLLTYPIAEISSKAQLLPREGKTQSALEFKPTWDHIDQVVDQLDHSGERLTKEDLLKKASDGKTLLHKGIEFGQTDKIFDILAISEDRLGKAELLDRNGGSDKSNLDLLAEQGKLALVFTPDNWGNNVREMQECWSRVHNSHKQQLDGKEGRPSYKRILQESNALSVKLLQLGARAVGEA